jgi:hypothetical protein
MAAPNNGDLAAPAQKYVGRMQVGGGIVPFQRWSRAYTREDRDRKFGSQGIDLRAERTASPGNPLLGDPKKDLNKKGA